MLRHVVLPGEGTERKKPTQTRTVTITLFFSLHLTTLGHCNLTLMKAAGHKVSGIQTISELLRESTHHPSCPESINGLTQTRLGEGIRV